MRRASRFSIVALSDALLLRGFTIATADAASAAAGDFQSLVDEAIRQGASEVTLPPGTYRVAPPGKGRWSHLNIQGAKDLTINARGVTLVCTAVAQALDVSDCTNRTLTGLTIDYDRQPDSRGE